MFSFLNEFPQIFAKRLYDEPNIDSKFFKQGSQGKRVWYINHWHFRKLSLV